MTEASDSDSFDFNDFSISDNDSDFYLDNDDDDNFFLNLTDDEDENHAISSDPEDDIEMEVEIEEDEEKENNKLEEFGKDLEEGFGKIGEGIEDLFSGESKSTKQKNDKTFNQMFKNHTVISRKDFDEKMEVSSNNDNNKKKEFSDFSIDIESIKQKRDEKFKQDFKKRTLITTKDFDQKIKMLNNNIKNKKNNNKNLKSKSSSSSSSTTKKVINEGMINNLAHHQKNFLKQPGVMERIYDRHIEQLQKETKENELKIKSFQNNNDNVNNNNNLNTNNNNSKKVKEKVHNVNNNRGLEFLKNMNLSN